MKTTTRRAAVAANTKVALPEGVLETDLNPPKYGTKGNSDLFLRENGEKYGAVLSFELWYTERFGWCIPTLEIRKASSRSRIAGTNSTDRRSYGISLRGEIVTIGLGPHIKRTCTVYVKASRQDKLQKFLDLRVKGLEQAGGIRDRISSRRADTIARRSGFGFGY